jgi:hypothetical protein
MAVGILIIDVDSSLLAAASPERRQAGGAIEAIRKFTRKDGSVLPLAFVSDFPRARATWMGRLARRLLGPWVDPAWPKHELAQLLERDGLRVPFGPGPRYGELTLGRDVSARLPDRRIFETAGHSRLDPGDVALERCLYLTGDLRQVEPCREMGLQVVRLGKGGECASWAEAPLVVARILDPAHGLNPSAEEDTRSALETYFRLARRVELDGLSPPDDDGWMSAQVREWTPIHNPSLEELNGVYVEMPVAAGILLDYLGRVQRYKPKKPSLDDLSEAAAGLSTLQANGRIGEDASELPPGVTHVLEQDGDGRRYLKARGFISA